MTEQSKTWNDVLVYIDECLDELQVLMYRREYARHGEQIRQQMAVMMYRRNVCLMRIAQEKEEFENCTTPLSKHCTA